MLYLRRVFGQVWYQIQHNGKQRKYKKKAKEVLRLTNLGKVVTLTNLPQFLSEIKRDAKRRKIFMNIQETYIPYEIDWGEPQEKEIWWN